jgi:hypothetical protein
MRSQSLLAYLGTCKFRHCCKVTHFDKCRAEAQTFTILIIYMDRLLGCQSPTIRQGKGGGGGGGGGVGHANKLVLALFHGCSAPKAYFTPSAKLGSSFIIIIAYICQKGRLKQSSLRQKQLCFWQCIINGVHGWSST